MASKARTKTKTVNAEVVAVTPPAPPPPKPRQEATRWDRIQGTRRRNARTGEPNPGSLGVAYLYSPTGARIEKVAVLTRDPDGKIRVQRAVGNQIFSIPLSFLRTYDEFWDGLGKVHPELRPANKIDPSTQVRWDFTKLSASVVAAVIKETE
jgi:hypothetical protein